MMALHAGARLREWRRSLGASRSWLADRIGASFDLVERIEGGDAEPAAELAERIAQATGGEVIFGAEDYAPVEDCAVGHSPVPPPSSAPHPLEPLEGKRTTAAVLARRGGAAGDTGAGEAVAGDTGAGEAGGVWEIHLWEDGAPRILSIAAARAIVAALRPLVELHDHPGGFE